MKDKLNQLLLSLCTKQLTNFHVVFQYNRQPTSKVIAMEKLTTIIIFLLSLKFYVYSYVNERSQKAHVTRDAKQ